MSFIFFSTVLHAQTVEISDKNHAYTQGVKLFLQSDYDQAQRFWRKAAREGYAKAMFNIGLLHERRLIENATDEQAEKWFNLAGDKGYAASYFHLAQGILKVQLRESEVSHYMNKAAKAGFVPALKRLGKSSIEVKSPTSSYLSQNWLKMQSTTSWTIQLLAFKDEEKVKSFIDLHNIKKNAAYFVENNTNGVWYKLVYGIYESKEKAEIARNKMSATLKEYGPWLRTVGSVKNIIEAK